MKGLLGGNDVNDFLTSQDYKCPTATARFQWTFLLNRLVRDQFQQRFEEKLIPAKEVYKGHAFVVKGKQLRVFLCSNSYIYNIEASFNPTLFQSLKVIRL
jgi:hypothetical protein